MNYELKCIYITYLASVGLATVHILLYLGQNNNIYIKITFCK